MLSLDLITPLILTYNEEANINRTLTALTWAKRVLVIDSYSDDKTLSICAQFNNVTVVQNTFESHAQQWNFGLAQLKEAPWVLALDADHVVSSAYCKEIAQTDPTAYAGLSNGFIFCQRGKALHGSLYPPLVALYRPAKAHYVQDGHTQRVRIDGPIKELAAKNFHDDRKSFKRWYKAQERYAMLEASKLASTPIKQLRISERARLIPFVSAPLVFVYAYFIKGVIRSGWAGFEYATQRTLAELILHIARIKRWARR